MTAAKMADDDSDGFSQHGKLYSANILQQGKPAVSVFRSDRAGGNILPISTAATTLSAISHLETAPEERLDNNGSKNRCVRSR